MSIDTTQLSKVFAVAGTIGETVRTRHDAITIGEILRIQHDTRIVTPKELSQSVFWKPTCVNLTTKLQQTFQCVIDILKSHIHVVVMVMMLDRTLHHTKCESGCQCLENDTAGNNLCLGSLAAC